MESNPKYAWPIFIGGIPAEATEPDVLSCISQAYQFQGQWDLTLKGKRGKNGHLGFGFIYCEKETDQLAFLKGHVEVELNGTLLECKKAWTIEEHKKKTHEDRLKKLYISCLKKQTKQHDIENYFSKFGPIKGITYGRDKNTSRRLGFCILEFEE